MTRGEKIVRTDFNVSKLGDVDKIKKTFAEAINLIDQYDETDGKTLTDDVHGVARLKALAITHAETACMYAVKAATTFK